jgi:hypothetical protein
VLLGLLVLLLVSVIVFVSTQLLGDPALRTRMGASGRDIVTRKFDLRKNVSQLIGSYGIS